MTKGYLWCMDRQGIHQILKNMEMKDLTSLFLEAHSYLKAFNFGSMESITRKISIDFDLCVSWDKDSGEEWGYLMKGDEIKVMFSARFPLFFCDSEIIKELTGYLSNLEIWPIVTIEVTSWTEKSYSIDLLKLKNVITWNSDLLSPSRFSMQDLWFATV